MEKTSKIIIGLLLIEAFLTGYYFYSQPQCEPCLPGIPCPPCISEAQIVTFWAGVAIAIIAMGYLFFISPSLKKYKH
jgi:hypothetical protein